MHTGDRPIVWTQQGPVRGVWRGPQLLNLSSSPEDLLHDPGARVQAGEPHFAAFLGIPFAQAPVGDLRFAAPRPMEPWQEPRDCGQYGPTPQLETAVGSLIPEPSFPGESTLNVNVFSPDLTPDTLAPVLVYIHGGGYTGGSPASPWYDGRAFNRDGIVTVSISYRLGFEGFGLIDGVPANRGVLDWVAALEWVQQNTHAFGGDPEDVTLAGQSAGGGAVLTLLGMPLAQSLFRRAWVISGVVPDMARERATEVAARLARIAGVPPTLQGFSSLSRAELVHAEQQLGKESERNVVQELREDPQRTLNFGPVIDGDLLQESALAATIGGVGADKHLLIGTTADEFTMLAKDLPAFLNLIPARVALRFVGLNLKGTRASRYLAARGKGNTAQALGRFFTDGLFRVPALRIARARGNAPTWLYSFNWVGTKQEWAIHCSDVPFWFDCLDQPYVNWLLGDDLPARMATQMHRVAVEYIVTGDPGWAKVRSEDQVAMVFDGSGEPSVDSVAYLPQEELLRL